ncbi:MAG: 4'-phosphopantetheinyl transferase superfamily protein [Gemmatimonadaceae bacterium]
MHGPSMLRGLGIDIVGIGRVERLLARLTPYGLALAFAPAERARAAAGDAPFAAGRLAAKEALLKAAGVGFTRGLRRLAEIEVAAGAAGAGGAPVLHVRGTVAALLAGRAVTQMHVSITHERDYAAAVVMLEG